MKVMIISHETDVNGATKAMIELIEALKDRVVFWVVLPGDDCDAYNQLIRIGVRIIVKQYYRWVYYKNTEADWNYWRNRWATIHDKKNDDVAKELATIIKKEKIDIVHTNVSVLDLGARIKRYTNVYHVWHFRELSDLSLKMYPLVGEKEFVETINEYSDICIFITKSVMNHYDRIDDSKKKLIYDAVDERAISINKEKHKGFNLLIAGAVCEMKGQVLAAKACSELVDECCPELCLWVAGKIDKAYEELLISILPNNIKICGYVDDMNSLREKMDVALVCTNFEAFGRSTAEAMFAAIPVIGSDSGGTPELIPTEEDGGILFSTGDYKDLKSKIRYLYDNPGKSKHIGECGRKRALDMFSMRRCAEGVYACYKEVVK